jgi:hypothetical protein
MRFAGPALTGITLSILIAGCSGGGGGGGRSATEQLSRVWEFQSGTLFAQATYSAGEANWLVLREDGTGDFFSIRPVSGAVGCTTLFFSVLDENVLQVEIPTLSAALDFAPGFAGKGGGGSSWLLAWDISGDELALDDAVGGTALFTRATEDDIPASERCELPLSIEEVPLPLEPYESDPVFATDGTNLWYATGYDFGYEQTGFHPGTGAVATTVNIDLPELFAWQGLDAWAGYASGHNQRLERLTPPNYSEFSSVDSIDTLYDLQNEVSMGNALIDSAGHLWMAGVELDLERPHIVVIDASAEPDVILSDVTLDTRALAIARQNGELWALQRTLGSMLVRLDPATGAVLRNVKLPEYNWQFLAVASGGMYLHAFDYTSDQHLFVRISLS